MTADMTLEQKRVEAKRKLARMRLAQMQTQPAPQRLSGETKIKDEGYISKEQTLAERGRTIFDQSMQGATFGFADEVSDRIGALIASKYTGLPYADLLKEARSTTKTRLEEQMKEMPVTSVLGNIAGGLVTGVGAGATKGGAAVSNWIRSGSLAAQAGKGAVAGATSGALYGAGSNEEDRLGGARTGALLGGVAGGAAPVLGNVVTRVLKKTPKSQIQKLTAEDLREQASVSFKAAKEAGGTLKPEFTNKFLDEVEKLNPQTEAGKIVAGENPVSKIVENIKSLRDRPLSLDEAQEIDEFLGEIVDSFSEMGKLTKQGRKLYHLQTSFRKMIDQADESLIEGGKDGFNYLKEARKLWSRAARLRDIERIMQKAQGAEQPATAIKNGFRALRDNPERLKGFTQAEQEAIKKAAEFGTLTDITRTFGSRLLTVIGAGTGNLGASVSGYIGSAVSRDIAESAQKQRAQAVIDLITGNAPPKLLEQRGLPNTLGITTGNIATTPIK